MRTNIPMDSASTDAEVHIVLTYRCTVRVELSEHLLQKQIMEMEGEIHMIIT